MDEPHVKYIEPDTESHLLQGPMYVNRLIRGRMGIARKRARGDCSWVLDFCFGNLELNLRTVLILDHREGCMRLWTYFTKTTNMHKEAPWRGCSLLELSLYRPSLWKVRPMMNVQVEQETWSALPSLYKTYNKSIQSQLTCQVFLWHQAGHSLSCLSYFPLGWLWETCSSVSSFYLHYLSLLEPSRSLH